MTDQTKAFLRLAQDRYESSEAACIACQEAGPMMEGLLSCLASIQTYAPKGSAVERSIASVVLMAETLAVQLDAVHSVFVTDCDAAEINLDRLVAEFGDIE